MSIDMDNPEVQKLIEEQVQARLDAVINEKISGLKSKNDELMGKLKSTKGLTEAEKEELQKLKEAEEARQAQDAEAKGQWEKLKEQLITKHTSEIESLTAQLGAMTKTLNDTLVDTAALQELSVAKGSAELLLPHIKRFVKVEQDGDKFVPRVVGADGNPRIGDEKGNPMTVKQLVEEFRKNPTYAVAFEGTGMNGGGATRSGTNQEKVLTRAEFDKLDPIQKHKFVLSEGGQVINDTN